MYQSTNRYCKSKKKKTFAEIRRALLKINIEIKNV